MIPIFQFIWSLLKTFETKRLMEQLEETADPRKRREIIRAIVQKKSRLVVRSLIKSLQNNNAAIRSGAAEALGLIGSSRAVMPLITIMNRDEEKIVRREVITALGNIRDFEATSPLIKVLEDQDKESRRRGVEALGKIGSRRAVSVIIGALSDQDALVRKKAIEALGRRTRDRHTMEQLFVKTLDDRNADVRLLAAETLDDMRWSPKTDQEQISYCIATRNWNSPILSSTSAVEKLVKMLEDERTQNLNARVNAAIVLGKSGDNRAVKPLLRMLEDENANIRQTAVAALGEIGNAQVINPLINVLKDENADVRATAATALGEVGDTQATAPLIKMIGATYQKDKNPEVRKHVVEALGKIRSAPAITMLIRVLTDDDDADVRFQTAEVLDNIRWKPQTKMDRIAYYIAKRRWDLLVPFGAQAVALLTKMTHDKSRNVRGQVTVVLTRILSSIEIVVFGNVRFERFNQHKTLYNLDSANLTVPISALRHIIIHPETYDFHLVERFLTYAVNYIGQQYLKQEVRVYIYGDPEQLHSNLRNSFENLCEQVEVEEHGTT
jgi:HEAT repeat protein